MPFAGGICSGLVSRGGFFAGTSLLPAAKLRARSLTSGGEASRVYLAADKIFLSNALGKLMSEVEIQIVFANGNAVAKECMKPLFTGREISLFRGRCLR